MSELIPVKYEYAPSLRNDGMRGMQHDVIFIETRDGFEGRKWAITQFGNCFGKDAEWEYESHPSRRNDEFKERCRWDSAEEALEFLRANHVRAVSR